MMATPTRLSHPRRRSLLGRGIEAWQRIRPLLGERSGPIFLLVSASVLAGLSEAVVLALVAQVASAMVVDDPNVAADLGPLALDMSIGAALKFAFAFALVRLVLQILVSYFPARISADVQAGLRHDLFVAYSRTSWPVQADEPDGHLQELMTSQVHQATQAVINVAMVLSAGAMFITLTASAFVLSAPVALIVLVSSGAMFALLRPLNRKGRVAARDLSQANMDHAAGVSESVRLAEESHVFGTADAHSERVGTLIENARVAFFRFVLAGRLAATTYQSIAIVLIVVGLAGLHVAEAGNIAVLGAVVLMLVRAATYGQHLQGGYHGLQQMLPYIDRLEGAIERYAASAEQEGGERLPGVDRISFDSVCFSYNPGLRALRDITFEIGGGESIGVVGPSGAGKSTLVQLLLRLREPDRGAFLVNGQPAGAFARQDWQRRVAYVSQEPRVFQGSVADNIRYLRQLDDAAVVRAARLAHIHEDVMAMPAGYDTVIGQRADAVSGGQRQRLCLARALAGDPDLLILDEPTSALDMASEAAIQGSLSDLHGRVTLIIVAHRVSTLSICDRILVLDHGQVDAFAPAVELVENNAFFRHAMAASGRPA